MPATRTTGRHDERSEACPSEECGGHLGESAPGHDPSVRVGSNGSVFTRLRRVANRADNLGQVMQWAQHTRGPMTNGLAGRPP